MPEPAYSSFLLGIHLDIIHIMHLEVSLIAAFWAVSFFCAFPDFVLCNTRKMKSISFLQSELRYHLISTLMLPFISAGTFSRDGNLTKKQWLIIMSNIPQLLYRLLSYLFINCYSQTQRWIIIVTARLSLAPQFQETKARINCLQW